MPFLGTVAFTAAGTAITYGTLVKGALVLFGIQESRRQKKAAKNAYNASVRDRKITIRSNESPAADVYGKTVLSGPINYAVTSGLKDEFLHVVIPLTMHEIDGIEDVLFDGESIGPLDDQGWVTEGKYFSKKPRQTAERFRVQKAASVALSRPAIAIDSVVFLEYNYVTDDSDIKTLAPGTEWDSTGTGVLLKGTRWYGRDVWITYQYNNGGPLVRVKKFLGIPEGERDTDLEIASNNEWSAYHVGNEVSRLHVTIEYDETVIGGGMPNISALARGKRLFDPRTNATAWSDNAALVVADYLRNKHTGFGCTATEIDNDLLIESANICDEPVAISDTESQARFTCDGVVYADAGRRENLQALLTGCVGVGSWSGGKWRILPAAYRPPQITLDENDMADGQVVTQSGAPFQNLFNAVRGQFIDPDNRYGLNDFPPYPQSIGPYQLADDGEFHYRDFQFPMCQNVLRAQRLAKLTLHRSRQAISESAYYKMRAVRIQPGDTVKLNRARDGWDEKEFLVLQRRFDPERMNVYLQVQEEAAEVYAEDFNEWLTPDPAPNTNLPDPSVVKIAENVTFQADETTFTVTSDGLIVPYGRVSWDPVTSSDVLSGGFIEVLWKWGHETEYRRIKVQPDAVHVDIEPVYAGWTVNILVYLVNGIQVRSFPIILTNNIGAVPATGTPTAGGNLVQSAGFAFTASSWRSTVGVPNQPNSGAFEYGAGYLRKPWNAFSAVPSNALLEVHALAGDDTGQWVYMWSPPFLLRKGTKYMFSGYTFAGFAKSAMGVYLFNDEDQTIGSVVAGEQFGIPSLDYTDIDRYRWASGIVPQNILETAAQWTGSELIRARFCVGSQLYKLSDYSGKSLLALTQPMVAETDLSAPPKPSSVKWLDGPQALTTPESISRGMYGISFEGELNHVLPHSVSNAVSDILVDMPVNAVDMSKFEIVFTMTCEVEQLTVTGDYGKAVCNLRFLDLTDASNPQYRQISEHTVADIWGQPIGSKREVTQSFTAIYENPPDRGQLQLFIYRAGARCIVKSLTMSVRLIK